MDADEGGGRLRQERDRLVAELYAAHGARLYRYALMILADHAEAEDVIQQVFTRLLNDRSPMPETHLPFLRTAVRNAAYSVFRHRRVRQAAADEFLHPVAGGCTAVERVALEQALQRLPAEQREVVHLHVYEGMTFKEAAAVIGDSLNTVAARYRYALDKLRQWLG